jgi:hypothetical protein
MGPTKRFRNDSIGYIKLDQLLGGNSMLFSSLRSSLGSLSQERCTGIWTVKSKTTDGINSTYRNIISS